jgi:putative alpha-1,2-mannosidase
MLSRVTLLVAFSLLPFVKTQSNTSSDCSSLVNIFIATQSFVPGTSYNGGNIFPGAELPFGVVEVGIDTTEFNSSTDANAGCILDGNVTAIRHAYSLSYLSF